MNASAFGSPAAHARDVAADARADAHVDVTDIGRRLRRLEDLVADPIEDAVHVLRRTMRGARRRVQDASDFKAATAYRVKRSPITAIGLAFGAGALMAGAVGLMIHYSSAFARTASSNSSDLDQEDVCRPL